MFQKVQMSNKSPIFSMQLDPHSHYFQVLEEARKHKQERGCHHLKIQKPKFQDNYNFIKKKSSRSKQWLKNAFRYIKRKLKKSNGQDHQLHYLGGSGSAYPVRASVSGPIYMTECNGSYSHRSYRTRRSACSGPLFMMGDNMIPYISLRELNVDQQPGMATAKSMPIYLVT